MECPICHRQFAPRSKRQRLCGERNCRLESQRIEMRERDRLHREQFGVSYFDRYTVERQCGCGALIRSKHAAQNPESTCLACQRRKAWRDRGTLASVAASRFRAEERRAARGQLVLAGSFRPQETLHWRQAAARLANAASGTRPKRAVWVAGTCARDGREFVALWTNGLPRYCSSRCLKAAQKERERLWSNQVEFEDFDPREIFERDGWRCQIPGCGKKVRRDAVVPHPLAPTLDHIVPRSHLGSHMRANVRCAHFICNSKRGNRGGNDQLLLIG